jgi:sugar lactone lactonase YvrE
VFVLDVLGMNLWSFDAQGRYSGEQQLASEPAELRTEGLAAGPDGTLWLRDRAGTITHRRTDGTILGSFAVAPGVGNAFAVAPDGHVLASTPRGVEELDATGAHIATLPLSTATAIAAAPDGDVLAGFAQWLQRVHRDGTGLTEIDRSGTAPGEFNQIEALDVAPAGMLSAARPGEEAVVVVDRENHRVQVLAPDWSALQVIGEPAGGSLVRPNAAWGTPDGGVLVGDASRRRIARFDATGTFTGRADGGRDIYVEAGALIPGTSESVVFGGLAVWHLGAQGEQLASWSPPDGGTSYAQTRSLAAAPDGTIYVADASVVGGGRVVAYATDGRVLRTITGPPSGAGRVNRPEALAVTPAGELLIANGNHPDYYGDTIDVYGTDGAYRRTISERGCLEARSLATDAAGRVYVGSGSKITVLTAAGALVARFGEAGAAPGQFHGTRLSMLGDILTITELGNNRVTRVRMSQAALAGPVESSPCGSVGLSTATLRVSGASARAPLQCRGRLASTCRGTIALIKRGARAGKLRRTDVLASAPFEVLPRSTKSVALKLRRAQRKILRSKRKLKLRLVIAPVRGPASNVAVTLRLPKRAAPAKRR